MIDPAPYKALRAKIRGAIGLSVGAPEIVFGCWGLGSIDPFFTWLMGALSFWHHCTLTPEGREVLTRVKASYRGCLLSRLVKELKKMDIRIDDNNVCVLDEEIRWNPWWFTVKPRLVKALKRASLHALEKRRPAAYGGLCHLGFNLKCHKGLLDSVPSYSGKILMRI